MLQACFPTAVQNRPTGKEKLEIDHRYKLISRLDSTAPWQLALPGEYCPDFPCEKQNKKICKIQPVGVWTSFLVGCCSERFTAHARKLKPHWAQNSKHNFFFLNKQQQQRLSNDLMSVTINITL